MDTSIVAMMAGHPKMACTRVSIIRAIPAGFEQLVGYWHIFSDVHPAVGSSSLQQALGGLVMLFNQLVLIQRNQFAFLYNELASDHGIVGPHRLAEDHRG